MSRRWIYIGCLVLGAALQTAYAALPGAAAFQYHARRWSVTDGLPQVTVTALAQDRRGFIWAGTQDGVARFDGTQFKVFNAGNTPSLAGNRIDALAADAGGRLWIATNRGLAVRAEGRFAALPKQSDMGAIRALTAAGGGVFIAAERGLFHIEPGSLEAHAVAGWSAGTAADRVAVDTAGRPWVAVKNGLYAPGTAPAMFRFYPLPDAGLTTYSLAWFAGQAWVGTNHGLYRFDGTRLVAAQPALAGRVVDALLAGPQGYLWIGTDNGLFRLDAQDGLVDFSRTAGLKDRWIWSLAADHSGDIWVGTGAHGMVRLWNNGITWFGEAAGLGEQLLTTVYADRDGSLLIGGRNGVYRYQAGQFKLLYGAHELPNPLVHGVLRMADGQLWVATIGGLAIVQHGKALPLPAALASLARANIYNVRQDADGTVWIATADGLYRYAAGQLQRMGADDGLDQKFVRGTFRASDGALWVATNEGAYRGVAGRFARACTSAHMDGPVADIKQDAAGNVWIAIAGGALYRYAQGRCAGVVFKALPLAGSLYSATPDNHGYLWLTNARGVYRVAVAAFTHAVAARTQMQPDVSITSMDGERQIHAVGGAPQAGLLAADGHLWVPTVDGLLVIDTREPPAPPAPAPVVVESVTRGTHVTAVLPTTRQITLPPGKTDLSIAYGDLDYHAPGSAEFEYRLSGYDANWIAAGTRREALYTHLPPGHYRFEVRALAGTVGGRAAPTAALQLELEPLFYQTSGFRALLVLVALGLIYAGYAFSMRRVRANQARLERLVSARTEELQAANAKLKQASVTDPLTGLRNRRYFMDVIEADIARSQSSGAPGTKTLFVMLDIDDFKSVNDEHGHHAGDVVLRQVGALLRNEVRKDDDVIRWGGEEFLIVAHNVDAAGALALVEKLRATLAAYRFKVGGGKVIGCTCSMGYCGFPLAPGVRGVRGWEQAVSLADAALYEAKRLGKNTWVGIRPTPAAADTDPEVLHTRLDSLIAMGAVTLAVMPGRAAAGAADTPRA